MELPPATKPSFISRIKSRFQKSSGDQTDLATLDSSHQHSNNASHNTTFASQTLQEGGAKSLNVTAKKIYATAAYYLSPAPAPPRTVNQYGEPMAILNPEPPKSPCRFSMFLNLVLLLGLISGIVLTACSGINETAAIIGPCFIVLSMFAICGKAYLTMVFNEDPLPLVSKYTNKLDKQMDKIQPPAFLHRKSSNVKPPPTWSSLSPTPAVDSQPYFNYAPETSFNQDYVSE